MDLDKKSNPIIWM